MQSYFFEIADFRLIDHEKLVASMTVIINGVIEIHNCNLIYSPKSIYCPMESDPICTYSTLYA